MLPLWGSVQVVTQTAGRGQLRRHWHSPPGNLYAALRLPVTPPFDGSEAAPALGMLLAEALRRANWPVVLKWPNDLVLCADGEGEGKVAGILLEERGGVLVAGIGINVVWAPSQEELRTEAALAATCLSRYRRPQGWPVPTAEEMWHSLVTHVYLAYTLLRDSPDAWRRRAESLLLWRGRRVVLREGKSCVCGYLAGLGPSGALLLERAGMTESFFSGSVQLLS